ncbi:zinc ABC transporter substrate-binding protein AztC [Nocardia pseudobrasiliensis]|uniref:Zinc/manganese transport system substrate-binding protein n=1 Tax=Nocardia pseudobrasiliensis TaxID=45979 RepID=A0A370HZX0_9NOCA|nr:zinc ABC transporter substrate-binding protein AztC [Nocardia pseudobrasiliensis]RDI63870.1 zinc/manganese transport system substrate-binding protein [Nocardia pseudobrasiliensis]
MISSARAWVLILLLTLAPACAARDDGRAHIVVTTNILGDLTRAVVGDSAEVTVLMPPNADPHQFAISARTAARIERADLLVHNGLGLEEGIRRHIRSAEDAGVATLAVGERVDPIAYRGLERGGPDPHFWTDPVRAQRAVQTIGDRIAGIPGVDANAVRANTSRYLAELRGLTDWMTERFAAVPAERRKLVTNHHVFGYLAQRFGFEVIGAVVPSGTTLASPSAADLAELAETVRAAGVPAIFADASQPDRLARVLAEQAGLRIRVIGLYSESLTAADGGAPTYAAMMRADTEAVVGGLMTS